MSPKRKENAVETAGHSRVVRKPRSWDKAVSCAYLRSLGASQEESAARAGCSAETLGGWEHSDWWPEAQLEAHNRWLAGVREGTRRGLLKALNDEAEYAHTARWASERLFVELMRKGSDDLNVNLNATTNSKVVLYFPDNQRGPGTKGEG